MDLTNRSHKFPNITTSLYRNLIEKKTSIKDKNHLNKNTKKSQVKVVMMNKSQEPMISNETLKTHNKFTIVEN